MTFLHYDALILKRFCAGSKGKLHFFFSKHKTSLSKLKNVTNERESRIKELEEKLAHEAKEQSKQLEVIQEEGRITTELTSLGAQCRGERHEQVIARQREALTELRIRIKDLEQLKPPSKCI